jgi:predicted AAA+ superfamily ATPase
MRYRVTVTYRPRTADGRVQALLRAMGGVVIEGARASGKTSTGLRFARSSIRLDASPSAAALADLDPASLLQGDVPRLIDEWQLAPNLWNVIRHEIDDRQAKGQFILSGSATPPDDIRRHSGAGRLARLRLRPMSLSESGRSSGAVSLAALPDQGVLSGVRSPLSYRDLATEAVRGGWPGLLEVGLDEAVDYNASYVADLCSVDIPGATGSRHDPVRLRRLLESLARHIATEASIQSLTSDVVADGASIDRGTVRTYLDALTTVFALEELPAWSVALRSRTRLRSRACVHLADPALACAALGVSAQRLAGDPEFFGQVFEAMAIRDLRVYADALRARVYHYRDETNLEADAIVEYPDGAWAACQVKLGQSMVEAAERNLLRLRDERVDTTRVGPPRFLAIVTGTEYGYTLPSGVHVIPLGALSA